MDAELGNYQFLFGEIKSGSGGMPAPLEAEHIFSLPKSLLLTHLLISFLLYHVHVINIRQNLRSLDDAIIKSSVRIYTRNVILKSSDTKSVI